MKSKNYRIAAFFLLFSLFLPFCMNASGAATEMVDFSLSEENQPPSGNIASPPSNGDYDGGDRDDISSPEPPLGWPVAPPIPIPTASIEPEAKPPSSNEPSLAYKYALLQPLFPAHRIGAETPPNTAPPNLAPNQPKSQSPSASSVPKPTVTKAVPPTALDRKANFIYEEIEIPLVSKIIAVTILGVLLLGACIIMFQVVKRGEEKSRLMFSLFCAMAVLSVVCFFLLKFQFDNRYSAPPSTFQGVLTLSGHQDFGARGFRFLWDGWLYYPGVFFAPADLNVYDNTHGDTYLGEYGAFRQGEAATYRLTIQVPSEGRYALELPQAHGPYCVWVNGDLVASYGMDGGAPDYPLPFLQISSVNGTIDLVIAVQSGGQFYEGLTTPPAFGTPERIWRLIQMRSIVATLVCGIAIFLGILYFIIGIKAGKNHLAFAFATLCLCYAGSILRIPVISTLGILPEWLLVLFRTSYYGIILSVLAIVIEIFQTDKRLRTIIVFLAILMCLWVVVYQFSASAFSKPWDQLFSASAEGYKYIVVLTLVGITAFSAFQNRVHGYPLLVGSLFFLAALLSDRLYPKYEPAFIHLPVETAAFLQIGIVAWVLISDTTKIYIDNLHLIDEKEAAYLLAAGQARQCAVLGSEMNALAELRHNMRSYLISVLAKCEQEEYDEAEALLRQSLGATVYQRLSNNQLVNAILSVMGQEAAEYGVLFSMTLGDLPAMLNIRDLDLCIVLSNLIRNAIEACRHLPVGTKRSIELTLHYRDSQFIFLCSNPQALPTKIQNGRLSSLKRGWGHGLGIKAVNEIVNKYGGLITIESTSSFVVRLLLPG